MILTPHSSDRAFSTMKPTNLLIRTAAILTALMTWAGAMAQSDVQFTQYWAVPTYYNPAYTGQVDFIRIRGGARLQWIGIENAPRSFMGAADMPVKLGKKSRLGVNVAQESLGLFQNLSVNAQVSYKFRFLKGVWSVGLQPAYYNSKFLGSEVYIPEGDDFHSPADEAIPTQDVAGNAFDISAGISYSGSNAWSLSMLKSFLRKSRIWP